MAVKLTATNSIVNFEYAIDVGGDDVVVSFFDRSNQTVRSAAASVSSGSSYTVQNKWGRNIKHNLAREEKHPASTYILPMRIGKERVNHAMCVSGALSVSIVLTTEKNQVTDIYNFLMKNYKLPLLPEWIPALTKYLTDIGALRSEIKIVTGYNTEMYIPMGNEKVTLRELRGYKFSLTEEILEAAISKLLKNGKIAISRNPQNKLQISDMDAYFKQYGSGVVDNLMERLSPISEHTDKIKYTALNNLRLYPQQISIVSGVAQYFRKNKGKYAFLNCGMGTGKVRRLGVNM